jgi:hypothetical protein
VVTVFTTASGPTALQVGQSTTIEVSAVVSGATGPSDGLFTYDLDLIAANLLPGQPSLLSVLPATRVGVNDSLYGGGDGLVTASGLAGIHGGFDAKDVGLTGPVVLFRVVVTGTGTGTMMVTPGPAVDPYGFDFLVYQSPPSETMVVYAGGILLQVLPDDDGGDPDHGGPPTNVPLPAAWLIGAIGAPVSLVYRWARSPKARAE